MTNYTFSPEIISAVTSHMNGDHPEDNLLIIRAFVDKSAQEAQMISLDGAQGIWRYKSLSDTWLEAKIPWGTPISDRPSIRKEVVMLYRAACAKLEIQPREH